MLLELQDKTARLSSKPSGFSSQMPSREVLLFSVTGLFSGRLDVLFILRFKEVAT